MQERSREGEVSGEECEAPAELVALLHERTLSI
jgi:hypothetical protein